MLSYTHCRHAAVSRIPRKRKFCKMNQSDCRNHKFPGFHDFMLDAIRGISQDNHCRGIQDTLNIKEKFCPGFHDFSQFSCPGFHENSKIACLCTVMFIKVAVCYHVVFKDEIVSVFRFKMSQLDTEIDKNLKILQFSKFCAVFL